MLKNELFEPSLEIIESFNNRILEIKKAVNEGKTSTQIDLSPLFLGNTNFVFRNVGIEKGEMFLKTQSIGHIIGVQQSFSTSYKNNHDIAWNELLTLPFSLYSPCAVFRSNSSPNNNLIVCFELYRRGSNRPFISSCDFTFHSSTHTSTLTFTSIYEKTTNPDLFFERLYRYGFCLYDSGESAYFNERRNNVAQKENITFCEGYKEEVGTPLALGQIPSSASVTTTSTINILSKYFIVKRYNENQKKKLLLLSNKEMIVSVSLLKIALKTHFIL